MLLNRLKKILRQVQKKFLSFFESKPQQNCSQVIPKIKYSDGSWLTIETTPDQKRIEDYLKKNDLKNKTILHIGTGNSSFAKEFCKNNKVDSITVVADELAYAQSLNLENYQCFKLNKYSSELKKLANKYDCIVDNNLSSFACCKVHFIEMIQNYISLLNDTGAIYTDQKGMEYHQSFAFPISINELKELFPQLAIKTDNFTIILSKNG